MIKKISAVLAALLGMSSCAHEMTHEASMNFDLENVRPFLERLDRKLALGLDIDRLEEFTARTKVENERQLRISVNFDGKVVPLEYRVYMDDIEAPDIIFFTGQPKLAEEILTEMDAFAEQMGI